MKVGRLPFGVPLHHLTLVVLLSELRQDLEEKTRRVETLRDVFVENPATVLCVGMREELNCLILEVRLRHNVVAHRFVAI